MRGADVDVASDPAALQRYALRLSEVIVELQSARREDYAEWRARETTLLEEVVRSQRVSDQRRNVDARLEHELQAEHRRRIDAEARLTSAERFRAEAVAEDRVCRSMNSHAAAAFEAETMEAREWRRQLGLARRSEEMAVASERLAEDRARRTLQEFSRHTLDAQRRVAESELQAKTSEAEALSSVWRLSGELRSELDACRWAEIQAYMEGSPGAVADGGRGRPHGQQLLTTRQALQDLRSVRERVDGLLQELPS